MYKIQNIHLIDTPALVVYPDLVKNNILEAIKMVGDPERLRPHIKTHKTAEVIKMCQEAGIQKFKCATIAEAELLGMCGAKDVLLAYQPIGPKASRFVDLTFKYPKTNFNFLIDNEDVVAFYQNLAFANNIKLNVYIDVNTGMNRTGISPNDVLNLANLIFKADSLSLIGLHSYDGHIRDLDLEIRKQRCDDAFTLLVELKKWMQQIIPDPLKIVVGGSPTFPIHAQRPDVECSPGTFVFWDAGYSLSCPEQNFTPAIVAVSRVISIPNETTICTDLGHKSIAAENNLENRVQFLGADDLIVTGQSEEHLVLKSNASHRYKVGDIFYGIPIHVCPTVALYERLFVVANQQLTGTEWKVIARDRKLSV